MMENLIPVTLETLPDLVAIRRVQGYRFVTMTCTDLGEAHDILYHFDKDYALDNLRLNLPKGRELPSISGLYLAAFPVENEIQDMFGIKVRGLAVDYEGKFILSEGAPHAPQNKQKVESKPQIAESTAGKIEKS